MQFATTSTATANMMQSSNSQISSATTSTSSTSSSCPNRSAQGSGGRRGVILGSRLLAACVLALIASATIIIEPVAASSIGGVGSGNQLDAASIPTAALCEPGLVEKMPPHIRKICTALESATQLSSSLYAYLHNQRSALLYQPDELALTAGSGIDKRTDVDHVFLRFGRRR